MSESIEAYLTAVQARYLNALDGHLLTLTTDIPAAAQNAFTGLLEASRYALEIGGKRIRPALCIASAHAVGHVEPDTVDDIACALEFVHTYSLVHDDLPAMDDDDLRRGKPSLHKAYDEATAILAGDGLQAFAFELLTSAPGLSAVQRNDMVEVLARAAGPRGMVGGQFVDVRATGTEMGLEQLKAMHSLKTGALIRASVKLGGIVANAGQTQLDALDGYGQHIGLAFQVVDDILDVVSDSATLGKTQGKDGDSNKPTYVKLLGLEGARAEAGRLLEEALNSLGQFGERADPLRDIARFIVDRDR